jgi:hypothetical protein
VGNSPSRLACRSCLPLRIWSSIWRVRATLSSSCTSLRLAIRARNWSTDSEPSLVALILVGVVAELRRWSTGLVQTAIDGKRGDSRSTSTNDGSEGPATQLHSAVQKELLLLLMVTDKKMVDTQYSVRVWMWMWAHRAVLISSSTGSCCDGVAEETNLQSLLLRFHCGHSEHNISTSSDSFVL